MKNLSLLFTFLIASLLVSAQYQTPGTGVNWGLTDLVNNSAGAVSLEISGQFTIHTDITISASDTLSIFTAEEINVQDGILVTVQGVLICQPAENEIIFFKASEDHYLGFRFEDSEGSVLTNTYFKKAGGIKLISSFVEFHNCDFTEFNQEYATGTVNLTSSSPLINNCSFTSNDGPAVMSAANSTSSPQIIGCEIKFNVLSNSNTPQINLGTSGADSIRIVNNEIIGNPESIMAGGIAITTLAGGSLLARIEGNTIKDNRYGITAYGYNIGSVIINNEIANNNTQNLPLLGGSGINFFGDPTNQSIVTGNIITGNLWGITIQGTAQPNFGQLEGEIYNPGENQFFGNGNESEIYDLYNNTPNTIMAQNNYWGTLDPDSVEMHIFHQPDDPSLGLIEYLPLYNPPVAIHENTPEQPKLVSSFFPNPASDHFYLSLNPQLVSKTGRFDVEIRDLSGKKLENAEISVEGNFVHCSLPLTFSGIAFVIVRNDNSSETVKVLVR